MDFAIGQVNSFLNLPDGQVKFLGEFKLQNCYQSIDPAHQNIFLGYSYIENDSWASTCSI